MSKCEISIKFDRDDRTYRGGETVGGVARIRANEDFSCGGIRLLHYWQTHGQGNSDCSDYQRQRLSDSCELQSGQTLELPFQFTADCHPLTYHGHLINLDQYVRVSVDVPWALDPKREEEYILRPGKRPPEMTGRRDEVIEFATKKPIKSSCVMKIIGGVIVLVILALLSAFLIILVPVILVALVGYFVWRTIIASRVGKVEFKAAHVVVAPGDKWPMELRFTPKKGFAINGITLKLSAIEEASSGSGTTRTTHRHTLHEEVYTLEPEGMLVAGDTFDRKFVVDLPETDAYSFDKSDNKITWSAEIRIDIPNFPDWKKTQVIQVVPREFLEEVKIGIETVPPRRETPVETGFPEKVPAVSHSAFSDGIGPLNERQPETEFGAPPQPAMDSPPAIAALLNEINQADEFGGRQNELVAQATGKVFDLEIDVDRIMSTFTSDVGDRYADGKTIEGTVTGTDNTVRLFTLNGSNGQVERLRRGDRWQTRVTVTKWDTLYDRLELCEVP